MLGGANRGRVPAHEREGSRTADEPAALSMRRGMPELTAALGATDDALHLPHTDPIPTTSLVVVQLDVAPLEPAFRSRTRGSISSRGPPHSVSLV